MSVCVCVSECVCECEYRGHNDVEARQELVDVAGSCVPVHHQTVQTRETML